MAGDVSHRDAQPLLTALVNAEVVIKVPPILSLIMR
jgi:hypothetical protein